jgi:hypothetical protein
VSASEICSKCLIQSAKALLIVKRYSACIDILLPFRWFHQVSSVLEKLIESVARTSASIAIQLDTSIVYDKGIY